MKNWKALLGTVIESIAGPQPLSFRNIENWDNLWQVIHELDSSRNAHTFYWECMTAVAFERGEIEKRDWYRDRIYAGDLLISMEYDLSVPNKKNIYIRRSQARRLCTPVEEKLSLPAGFSNERQAAPYILYFTDYNGVLLDSYPVVRWLELIDIWSSNGIFQPVKL
jgi:hypothetical protein